MGYEVKRVSPSFEWPIDKVWNGYINPFYSHKNDCTACGGSGYSPQGNLFKDQWYGYVEFDPVAYGSKLITPETPALKAFVERKVDRSIREAAEGTALDVVDGQLTNTGKRCYYTENGRYTRQEAIVRESHRLLEIFNNQWHHHLIAADVEALIEAERLFDLRRNKPSSYMPTPEEVNAWSIGGFGHDSINAHVCIEARCKREGYAVLCDVCGGSGDIWQPSEAEQWAEDWEREEPPAGEAYQIWETVSEGSPISPVFSNPQILAEWMANTPRRFGEAISAERWLEWITGPGWSPSGMTTSEGYKDGVAAMTMPK